MPKPENRENRIAHALEQIRDWNVGGDEEAAEEMGLTNYETILPDEYARWVLRQVGSKS